MSVINKMLRDLDQRQSPATGGADPLRRHTVSVAAQPAARRPSSALRSSRLSATPSWRRSALGMKRRSSQAIWGAKTRTMKPT